MNPAAVYTELGLMPYVAAGIIVVVLVSLGVWIFSTRGFSADSNKEPLIV